MRSRLAVFLILGVATVAGLLFARQAYLSRYINRAAFELPKVRVLTYSTFVGATGPGADLIQRFKTRCQCEVEVVSAGDAGLILERLKLAEASTPFDVVIGLDQVSVPEAEERFKWRDLFFGQSGRHPVLSELISAHFVPLDWSPLTFIYRKDSVPVPPKNLADLLRPEFKQQFALQDPRSSSPGRQFVHWIQATQGPKALDFFTSFKPNVHSISPSWAFSYGLFKKEQTKFVFSYLTSLAFHWGVEDDRGYQALILEDGHPVQVEYMGVPASCRQCALAEQFVESLLEPEAQKIIMEKNFMLPVIQGLEEGSVFAELPQLKILRTNAGKDLSEWDKVFKR